MGTTLPAYSSNLQARMTSCLAGTNPSSAKFAGCWEGRRDGGSGKADDRPLSPLFDRGRREFYRRARAAGGGEGGGRTEPAARSLSSLSPLSPFSTLSSLHSATNKSTAEGERKEGRVLSDRDDDDDNAAALSPLSPSLCGSCSSAFLSLLFLSVAVDGN